eukprot:Blabericola_migrator_1__3929@NODE_218_length_11243_cov_184_152827_g185_i0_p8_GENE_NODE_218_length_11243_cov_184_152827_g185_i0NODE_218_length_11243_cov_184_152827_g185_i0_p8_ORF_typecomplete_len104_score8_14RseC_MucC/PF04246_12/0_073_NODE_218_length_11243_cov_184_152827_g185_i01083811149
MKSVVTIDDLPTHPDQTPGYMVPRRVVRRMRRQPSFTYTLSQQLKGSLLTVLGSISGTAFSNLSKTFVTAALVTPVGLALYYLILLWWHKKNHRDIYRSRKRR